MSGAASARAAEGEAYVLAFGDSLTAGYGLPREDGFAPQLEAVLRKSGVDASVVNAGVSGDTAGQGRARLVRTLDRLKRAPDLAIVALGANDMLRGIAPERTRADLDAIIAELKRRGIPVLIAGMYAAPYLGPNYRANFNAIFADLAREHGAALYPFFLAGVAGDPALALFDRVHPNAKGVAKMARGIAPTVLRALGR